MLYSPLKEECIVTAQCDGDCQNNKLGRGVTKLPSIQNRLYNVEMVWGLSINGRVRMEEGDVSHNSGVWSARDKTLLGFKY